MDDRPGPWLRWVLIASLALNLLVVCAVAFGLIFGGGHHDKRRDGRPDPRIRAFGNVPFVMALTPQDRAALLERAALPDSALRENRAQVRARFEQTLEVLRNEPFDPDALLRLLEAQRTALFDRQRLGEAALVEQIAAMDPAQRAAYTDRLDRSLHRGPRKRD
ncbi:periplasmic heavy metal sensor [Oceaniglobus indicus]|uniref:periplasmic heavy metal sensor n=1 Tax=Oceaniglobus indicus TaxID=2047749 RepID=UPI001303F94D|nr:periplasmic heavy metal sensor [Oceaniglobus indicus]